MVKSFAFRLDAGVRIGTGHFMRCLAIANELGRHNSHCHFICRELLPPLHSEAVNQGGHTVHTVCNEEAALDILAELKPACLIIDHYGLDARFEIKARTFSKRILVIDDLANRSHCCDFLLDQGPLRTPEDYQHWIDRECQYLLGSDYALIRPEFRQMRKTHTSSWKRGLICFGGADPGNVTLVILEALDSQHRMKDVKWTAIAGTANPHWQELKHFASSSRLDLLLIKQSDRMAKLMAEHDFAIGAAGSMTWERACIGIPTLTIPIADNQALGIEAIRYFGLGETLKVSELTPTTLVSALERLQQQADVYLRRNQAMVDGLGVVRLSKSLLQIRDDLDLP